VAGDRRADRGRRARDAGRHREKSRTSRRR
jgi:hypothetical protein